jgi:predicted nucleic acid-binding protein
VIISDTSVISNLISIEHIFLLEALYQKVIVPQAVYQELFRYHPIFLDEIRKEKSPFLEVKTVMDKNRVYQLKQSAKLDDGESEAIILALELKTELLLIDERKGRAEAQRLGIKITGLLGVLLEGKTKGLIIAVKPLMDRLIEDSDFWISHLLYDKILVLAQEKSENNE